MQRYEKKLRYASLGGRKCVEYAFYMHTLMPIYGIDILYVRPKCR